MFGLSGSIGFSCVAVGGASDVGGASVVGGADVGDCDCLVGVDDDGVIVGGSDVGDCVVGDDDGVVVVARHRLAEVAGLAAQIAATEDAITKAVLGGATIAAARKQHGYHTLQRKER